MGVYFVFKVGLKCNNLPLKFTVPLPGLDKK